MPHIPTELFSKHQWCLLPNKENLEVVFILIVKYLTKVKYLKEENRTPKTKFTYMETCKN